MNKYQDFALKYTRYVVYEDENGKKTSNGRDEWLNASDGKITIQQSTNYNITKYYLRIDGYFIKSVVVNGKEAEIKFTDSSHPSPVVEVDFNNRIKELTIVYRDVVDPITIPVEFIEADRSIYDAQVQKETNALIKPEHKTGNDLVNIYWNLVNDKIEIVKINLYSVSNNETRLIGKYKEEEAMFKSITGLAYGKYCYEIIEIDGAGNEVARTGKIEFTLSAPNYSGRNTVTFSR